MEHDVYAQQRIVAGERAVEETTYATKFMVCNQACVSNLEGQRMTPEDEAFNDIERQAKQRKEAVLQALHDENERLGLYADAYGEKPTRAQLIAEVAVLTELVRVLSDRVAELEKNT